MPPVDAHDGWFCGGHRGGPSRGSGGRDHMRKLANTVLVCVVLLALLLSWLENSLPDGARHPAPPSCM